MEALLPVETCFRCGHRYAFRLSRFGCVFSCACDECIDVLKVAAAFSAAVRGRTAAVPFVPVMLSPSCELTFSMKMVSVEVDFVRDRVSAHFRNFHDAEVAQIAFSLSLALREQLARSGVVLTGPAPVIDQLTEELLESAQDPALPFFVNPPPPGLRKAVAGILSCAVPETRLDRIPHLLRRAMKAHQVEGVRTALRWGGRILFADDMGVGKTMQALATVAALEAYPLLIVCPSALKLMWADLIEQYLHEQVSVEEMHPIHGANDALSIDSQPKVVLVSYHMAAVLEKQLQARSWKCLLCDESHLLHTNVSGADATYTRVVVAIGKRAPHCLLLSGTPATDNPFDLFNQIDTLRPNLLGESRFEFAMRYCQLTFSPYLQVGESTRRVEFSSLLRSCCMLRRLKEDVLELPRKSRVVMRVAHRIGPHSGARCSGEAPYQERYANSWKANWNGIAEAVEHCCSKYDRVVLLAHHIELIDSLVQWARDHCKRAVRIDGRVPVQQRGDLLHAFHRGEARIAVIGITACAVGISLAPAQCAVFCELPPDAAWMRQAEDRLHRPGQRDEVVVYYLLGLHSQFDAELFSRLCRSLSEAEESRGASLSLSQIAHASHPALQLKPASNAQTHGSVQPTAEPLLFCISKNTGRIHVRASRSTGFYTTFPWHEARQCVQKRQDLVWQQLDTFLESVARLSPFHRRQLVLCQAWLPPVFQWKSSGVAASAPRRRNRYAKTLTVGWGVWWEVRRLYFPTRYYFGPLTAAANNEYEAGCLNCAASLPQLDRGAYIFVPGAICGAANGDSELFCSGKCRLSFFIRRSGGAIRRSVAGVDKSVCSHCHVDCETLCTSVAAAAGRRERVAVIGKLHPQLLQFPALCEKVVSNPIPGNFWHVDHVVPVAWGGGEATLDNLQTLCVVCHALKTHEDMRQLRQKRALLPVQGPVARTTVDVAWIKVTASSGSRVTWRKV
ncbi:putative SNF2/RAD54 related DNA helicase [Leishmania infantum JPCM5]|uniref:SNF2/RAD54_related_DNA_helicase_-_putative n=2 Tax=Leishmania infantum TaxID=5671 RepID=A0A6L0WU42_LEIIN|nr:putative SNF2/RAD54 related DNA helicase [Leishmania infantum JPCM5]CAC9459575.1 SNF2/RAD54_related_DNA_helicase_-_putative [Leishmania infantum]CAM66177.1 putative SNF2/RAD54 related DNA helicase [Leishmania infantum JPCM5]SUZ39784.1 SNF2/RAD54_related_DNA_helicase_-_putative [Leishmania infantum]|eukprot:XP_001463808.1 putative SNF2/RAD54 related DNA helicase [Leishmania infantum JPCM5]